MGRLRTPFLLAIIMLVSISSVSAKGLYVRDRANINLRKSPSENSGVVGLANTNDYLEIKEETGEWVKVITPDGQEGWVPMRFMTTETPRSLVIDQLNEKIKTTDTAMKTLKEENRVLQKENQELKYNMSSLSADAGKSKQEYQRLRQSSSEFLKLEADYKKLTETDKSRSKEMIELAKENQRLRTSERIMFTLIGGGFILIGAILGPLTQGLRGKPKKSGYKI